MEDGFGVGSGLWNSSPALEGCSGYLRPIARDEQFHELWSPLIFVLRIRPTLRRQHLFRESFSRQRLAPKQNVIGESAAETTTSTKVTQEDLQVVRQSYASPVAQLPLALKLLFVASHLLKMQRKVYVRNRSFAAIRADSAE